MFDAYHKIFQRVGLDYEVVQADTGLWAEVCLKNFKLFVILAKIPLVICSDCGYATNSEVCECKQINVSDDEEILEKEMLHTPGAGTIKIYMISLVLIH